VVFRSTTNFDLDLIKRIIGVPGDDVRVADGRVIVNGLALSEPYINAEPRYSGDWSVPRLPLRTRRQPQRLLRLHAWGLLPIQNVIGKAILIYWRPGLGNDRPCRHCRCSSLEVHMTETPVPEQPSPPFPVRNARQASCTCTSSLFHVDG